MQNRWLRIRTNLLLETQDEECESVNQGNLKDPAWRIYRVISPSPLYACMSGSGTSHVSSQSSRRYEGCHALVSDAPFRCSRGRSLGTGVHAHGVRQPKTHLKQVGLLEGQVQESVTKAKRIDVEMDGPDL